MGKYRVHHWIDLRDGSKLYGIQKHHEGRWHHCHAGGEPLIYLTKGEADEKLRELRGQQGGRSDGQ